MDKSKLAVVAVCFAILVGGCETPSGGDPNNWGWATGSDSSTFTPGGPSGLQVNPRPRRQARSTGGITDPSAVVSKAPKYPTVANLIRAYEKVALASYPCSVNYDPAKFGIVRDNCREGHCLLLNADIVISPAPLEEGARGFIVYTSRETRVYEFPKTPASVEETEARYEMRVRLPNGELLPISIIVPRLRIVTINVNFENNEDFDRALERQKKELELQTRGLEQEKLAYRIYLMSEEASSGYHQVVDGHKVQEEIAVDRMVYEIQRRLEEILSYSLRIGMDFRGGRPKFVGVPEADKELANKPARLAAIEDAMRACREIDSDPLQRTVDQMQAALGYSK